MRWAGWRRNAVGHTIAAPTTRQDETMPDQEALIQAAATIVAGQLQADVATSLSGAPMMNIALPTRIVQTYRAVEAALEQINREDGDPTWPRVR
jgi:hypothetical protein